MLSEFQIVLIIFLPGVELYRDEFFLLRNSSCFCLYSFTLANYSSN